MHPSYSTVNLMRVLPAGRFATNPETEILPSNKLGVVGEVEHPERVNKIRDVTMYLHIEPK